MTVRQIATEQGIKPASLRRKIDRRGFGLFGVDDELPADVLEQLTVDRKADPVPHAGNGDGDGEMPEEDAPEVVPPITEDPKPEPKEDPKPPIKYPPRQPRFPAQEQRSPLNWRSILPVLPLPMLGLAASYGVFLFASKFVPIWVAVVEAAGFELVYIGLSAMIGLSEDNRRRANLISLGAVAVSITYNALAGAIEMQPDLLQDLPVVWFWLVSFIHGAPLALLAYAVADLTLHK